MRVALAVDPKLETPSRWGVAQLQAVLEQQGHKPDETAGIEVQIRIGPAESELFDRLDTLVLVPHAEESYAIRPARVGKQFVVAIGGRGERGVQYGCLDAAEQIIGKTSPDDLKGKRRMPFLPVRGIYTFLHNSDLERDWLYNEEYWTNYFNMLAWMRFNRFNLVFGHQTAHLIPIYAFLLDMERDFPDIRVDGLKPDERRRNLEMLRMVSRMCSQYGIDFFLGIWQARPWKRENGLREDQPTRVRGTDDLGRLTAYTREGLTRLLRECPEIRGLQLRMNRESGVADQRFFVAAMVPALRECGRPIKVNLRNWGLKPETIEAFRASGAEVEISVKYFAEHQVMPYQPPMMRGGYSYDSLLRRDREIPLIYQLWNLGSHRLFLWGDPDFGRRFAQSCELGWASGFEVTPPGSQKGFSQWGPVKGTWRIFKEESPFFRWEFQRYWFFFMAFGRPGYNRHVGDEVFQQEISHRFGLQASEAIFRAYQEASRVLSLLVAHHMDDRNMYVWPELDCGGPIDHYAHALAGEETLFPTIAEWADLERRGAPSAKAAPAVTAGALTYLADRIEEQLTVADRVVGLRDHEEYRQTRTDFRMLASLARYRAAKTRAAAALQLFYVTADRSHLDEAERQAEEALGFWRELTARAEAYYNRLHLGPSGGHWRDNRGRVEYDLARVRQVRELFRSYGLFDWGFDFGPSPGAPRRPDSVLDHEPRFLPIDHTVEYWPETGYGWVAPKELKATPVPRLGNQLARGVFYIRPDRPWDPSVLEKLPFEALTGGYVEGAAPARFRVDCDPGRYEVTLLAPPETHGRTTLSAARGSLKVLKSEESPYQEGRIWTVDLSGSGLVLTLDGGAGPWRARALVVRPAAPKIAHQHRRVLRADAGVPLRVTVTAPGGVKSVTLRYRCGGRFWHKHKMEGDGTLFATVVPNDKLDGQRLEYYFTAVGNDGRKTDQWPEMYSALLVRGFKPPAIVEARGPGTWRHGETLQFRTEVKNGEYARKLTLLYREADQNREWRSSSKAVGRSGTFVFQIDSTALDPRYELLYYFELIDAFGQGRMWPDPWNDARYRVARPAP